MDLRYINAAYGLPPKQQYANGDPWTPVNTGLYPVQPIWQTPVPPPGQIAAGSTWQQQ
jgi:hypothetical protein